LALLSGRKSTVFDNVLHNLIDHILEMKFTGEEIYKIQKPSDDEAASQMGSEIKDGNEFYLSNEVFLRQIQLVSYIIDDMASEPILKAQPVGFKDLIRVQNTIVEYFKKQMQ
jgi:hypothetical protein